MPLIADLSLTITPSTALYGTTVLDANITVSESTIAVGGFGPGHKAIVLDFYQGDGLYARDLGTTFSWPLSVNTVLHVWQPSIIPQPETIYGRASDWNDGGHVGDKFVQGYQIEASSFAPKTAVLQSSDDLSFHALLEMPVTFSEQSVRSFSCVPFVAHSVRLISTDGVPWKVFDEKLVFQPWPASCLNWATELTSLGLTGWGHIRELNVPHVSTADLMLTLTFDTGLIITLTIPNSGGLQAKTKVTLPPNKFKLCSVRLSSTQPFRIFETDVEVKIKQWGSQGAYQALKPIGGASRTGATV